MHINLKFLHITIFSPHISLVILVTNIRYDFIKTCIISTNFNKDMFSQAQLAKIRRKQCPVQMMADSNSSVSMISDDFNKYFDNNSTTSEQQLYHNFEIIGF